MNKEIEPKFSFKTRLAIALSSLAFVTAGCGNFETAPSYGDCLNAGGSNEQCLEIWDPHALSIQKNFETSNLLATQQVLQEKEDSAIETKESAPRHQMARVRSGEGILDVLVRMGFNLNAKGPMAYSQIIAVTINGEFRLFTLEELLNSDPFDQNYRVDVGDCVITAPDQFGIDQAIEQNQDICP